MLYYFPDMSKVSLRVAPVLFFAALVFAAAVRAGIPHHLGQELSVDASPVDVAVLADRVIALAIDGETSEVRWFDSADLSLAPQSYQLAAAGVSTLSSATLSGDPVLLVGGSQVDVLRFDVSTTPTAPPSVSAPLGLGPGGGDIGALTFDASRLAAYGADIINESLRHINLDGSGVPVDFIGGDWPIHLGFVPADLALLDPDTLIVVGESAGEASIALVDLSIVSEPELVFLDSGLMAPLSAAAVSVAADYNNSAWVLLENGQIWALAIDEEGDGDDDDDTVGDDDDSALGDDDDSALGDDDDSALGDDDDSASSGNAGRDVSARDLDALAWTLELLISTAPSPPIELVYGAVPLASGDDDDDDVDSETVGYLYSLGRELVSIYTTAGAQAKVLAFSGAASGLAAASGADGHAYVSLSGSDALAVLTPGPWVDVESVSPTTISSDLDTISVDFSVSFGGELAGSCAYSFVLEGDIAGSGTPIVGASGTIALGEVGNEVLSGADLLPGTRRVFVFCEDSEGDVGRASFTYYKGYLAVPSNFSATPGDQEVRVRWDTIDSEEVSHYLVYFDSETFTDLDQPDGCNADLSQCSPFVVVQPDVDLSLGDDDTVGDDDDSAVPIGLPFSVLIEQLANAQPWYFALAAVDLDGNIGPRTEVLSATPSVTGGAAALAGDSGGCTCESSFVERGVAATPMLLFAFLLLATQRRRRSTHGY